MTQNIATDDLNAQRAFVKDLVKKGFNYSLIAAEAFVRGMRDSGYRSTATAINELIDNAIQAQADMVDVVMGYADGNSSRKKLDHIAVIDNGHGMDPDVMRLAVLWGGTHREGDRSGFGRFGFGLPSAAVSVSRRYSVYSKVAGGDWHRITIDIQEITDGKLTNKEGVVQAPAPAPSKLPKFVSDNLPKGDLPHGTVVVLEELDRLSPGFVTSEKFQEKMLHNLGLIYRGLLRNVKMRVIDTTHEKGKVKVEPIDPLFLTPGARYHDDNAVMAEALPDVQFKVKEQGSRGKEIGTVRVRYAYLPPGFQEDSPGRMAVMKDNNGLVIMRAGRQIDVVSRIPDITIINYDRNWSIEVDFEPTLDEEFGVTTNKQQITITDRMWDLLDNNGLFAAIAALRKRYRKELNDAKADKQRGDSKPSEEVAKEATKFRTRKDEPTPEEAKKRRERLRDEVKRRARETGRPEPEIEAEIEGQQYKVDYESLPGAPFYRMLQVGGQRRLLINTAHSFYTDVYNGPRTSASVRTSLELMLIVLGECEVDSSGERQMFYVSERAEWSRRLETMLELADKREPTIDEESAELEEAEARKARKKSA